ncbi:retrovirus-related pol polyprotein from transposon TNT 1-94 [Tanacetum coccineum]|uniref:Retrovirus-related pol polyprotein from transposon TNT 1-94 n=1 Tax=Tanacetum coccineum TaxID=301880 RepID=A0ABQ5AAZ5_9ASTR
MLKKFGLKDSKPTKTPMSTEIKLTKDDEADSMDSSKYRGMIGSLLYLTASRPDIMFSVCLCARFQENPKTTHLEAVKSIFRLEDTQNSTKTPMSTEIKLTKDDEADSVDSSKYREGIDYDETFAPVARLKAIRIFLAYAAYMGLVVFQVDVKSAFVNRKILEEVYVQQLPGFDNSRFPNHYQANPKESHFVAVKRIFRYLKGTPNLDRKSTSRGCQILDGKLVCWSAKKQSFVAMSSTKAEYIVAAECCAPVLWIKSQLADYNVLYNEVPIFCDNTSFIAISNNPVFNSRTKHNDIRYHFIRDHILKGEIELHFVPIDLQLADIFTKPLALPSFTRFVPELGMLNIKKEVSDNKKTLSDALT